MADKKITQLTNITGANLVDADEFVVVDISADETKAITLGELKEAFDSGSGFVRITGDTMTGDLALSGADVTFGDNDKAIFGAGSDLQIYSDGNTSFIKEGGSGNFAIDGTNIFVRNGAGTANMAAFVDGGAATLYHNSSDKLATTSTGVNITGTLSSDGLTVDAANGLVLDTSGATEASWTHNPANGESTISVGRNAGWGGDLNINTDTLRRMRIQNNGDISFYDSLGSSQSFFWDASEERLGIGTTSPSAALDLVIPSPAASASSGGFEITEGTKTFALSTTGSSYSYAGVGANELWYYGNSNFDAMTFGSDGAVPIKFIASGSERMRIDSSGNVGIGTSTITSSAGWTPKLVLSDSTSPAMVIKGANSQEVSIGSSDGLYLDSFGSTTGSNNRIVFRVASGNSSFAASEAMRIDSSGNLLVGKTGANSNLTGVQAISDGRLFATASGSYALVGNRLSSDGDIALFQKDGTTVGSIGSAYGVVSYINLDPRSGGTGVGATNTDSVIPVTGTGVGANGTKDLGISSARWRDLYLSGVGYVGTTQEANTTLSGTTPSIDADTAGSFTLTTSGNTTFTFASVTSGRSVGFVLKLTAGGGHTITWPSSVDWAGGTAPDAPASGETDVLVFYTVDGGTNWYGVLSIDAAA